MRIGQLHRFGKLPALRSCNPPTTTGARGSATLSLREETQRWRPLGRAFDPRVAIIKDTPGPLTVVEYDFEVTV